MRRCNCCFSTFEYVRRHYNHLALVQPGDDPKRVLALFRQCFPDCDLTLWDVHEYLGMVEAK